MKTIKELETREGCEYGPTWDGQNMGYFSALKDVLELIDEDIKQCGKCPTLLSLKARIKG